MATITAQSIVARAQTTLLDETGVRWNTTELVQALNDGQREIVVLKPDAHSVNGSLTLAEGTRQTIAAEGVILLDVIRNLGVGGDTPGRAITRVKRGYLDTTRPNWHAESPNAEVLHYLFDERDPKHFYVTPPQPISPSTIEYVYSAAPIEVAEPATANGAVIGTISIDDIYQTALFYYMMFRAHSKESSDASPQKASAYYQLFAGAVSGKARAEAEANR